MAKLEYTLDAVNQRLRDGSFKARVKARGGMLLLQATLPPKPWIDRPKPYQQEIRLGVAATEAGFKRAEAEAKLLSTRLALKEFDWMLYTDEDSLPDRKPAKRWIEEFKKHYFESHTLKEKTWKSDFDKIYKRLPSDAPITLELLLDLVHATERNTRNRLETCHKLQALADFAGIKAELLKYRGNYGSSTVKSKERELPTDEAIAQMWSRIPNPNWQWIFGIIAACGLRDHEAFFCEWRDDGLFVTKGKTGSRLVFEPLYPEWVDQWNLRNIQRPNIDADAAFEAGTLGDKVARGFRRYKVPFSPYYLRRAFGVRATVTFEFPVSTSAQLMGHSPQIHLKEYQKYLNVKHSQESTKRIMARPDRPQPPQI